MASIVARATDCPAVMDFVMKEDDPSKKPSKLPMEASTVRKLLTEWNKAVRRVKDDIRDILSRGFSHGATSDQVNQIFAKLNIRLSQEFGAFVSEDVGYFINKAYKIGKMDVLRNKALGFTMEGIDRAATAWLTDHHLYWIRTYYERHLSEKIATVVREGIGSGLGRAEIGDTLEGFLKKYPGVQVQPSAYYRGLAANAMNRCRVFGKIQAYQDAEVKYVRWANPLDDRTSDFCRAMVRKGKIPVVRVIRQRNKLMDAIYPDDVRSAAPWVKVSQIENLTMEQINAMNVVAPPGHFHCRSELVEA